MAALYEITYLEMGLKNRKAVYVTMFAQLYFYICMFSFFKLLCIRASMCGCGFVYTSFCLVNGVNWRNRIVTMFAFLQIFFMFSQGLLLKVYLQEGFTIKIAANLYHSHILPCRSLALCTPRLPYPLDSYYN